MTGFLWFRIMTDKFFFWKKNDTAESNPYKSKKYILHICNALPLKTFSLEIILFFNTKFTAERGKFSTFIFNKRALPTLIPKIMSALKEKKMDGSHKCHKTFKYKNKSIYILYKYSLCNFINIYKEVL